MDLIHRFILQYLALYSILLFQSSQVEAETYTIPVVNFTISDSDISGDITRVSITAQNDVTAEMYIPGSLWSQTIILNEGNRYSDVVEFKFDQMDDRDVMAAYDTGIRVMAPMELVVQVTRYYDNMIISHAALSSHNDDTEFLVGPFMDTSQYRYTLMLCAGPQITPLSFMVRSKEINETDSWVEVNTTVLAVNQTLQFDIAELHISSDDVLMLMSDVPIAVYTVQQCTTPSMCVAADIPQMLPIPNIYRLGTLHVGIPSFNSPTGSNQSLMIVYAAESNDLTLFGVQDNEVVVTGPLNCSCTRTIDMDSCEIDCEVLAQQGDYIIVEFPNSTRPKLVQSDAPVLVYSTVISAMSGIPGYMTVLSPLGITESNSIGFNVPQMYTFSQQVNILSIVSLSSLASSISVDGILLTDLNVFTDVTMTDVDLHQVATLHVASGVHRVTNEEGDIDVYVQGSEVRPADGSFAYGYSVWSFTDYLVTTTAQPSSTATTQSTSSVTMTSVATDPPDDNGSVDVFLILAIVFAVLCLIAIILIILIFVKPGIFKLSKRSGAKNETPRPPAMTQMPHPDDMDRTSPGPLSHSQSVPAHMANQAPREPGSSTLPPGFSNAAYDDAIPMRVGGDIRRHPDDHELRPYMDMNVGRIPQRPVDPGDIHLQPTRYGSGKQPSGQHVKSQEVDDGLVHYANVPPVGKKPEYVNIRNLQNATNNTQTQHGQLEEYETLQR